MSNITVTLSSDESRLLRALDRVVAKEKEVARSGKQAGKEQEEALGGVESAIESVLTKFGPWAAGVAVVTAGFQKMKDEVDGVAESLKKVNELAANQARSEGAAFSKLAQLAPGDSQKFSGILDLAKQLKDQGGVSESEATQTMFGLGRAGLLNQGGTNVAIQAARLGLGGGAVERAAAIEKAFGRQVTAEGVQGLLGRAVELQPGDTEGFLASMTKAAPLASGLGISEDELVAAEAQMSKVSSSPEQGARALHQLLEGFAKHRVRGGSLAEMISSERGRGGSPKKLVERYGAEGLNALRLLDPGALSGGDASSTLGSAIDVMQTDPGIRDYLNEREANANEGRLLESRGRAALRRSTVRAEQRNFRRNIGLSESHVQTIQQLDDDRVTRGPFADYLNPDAVYGDATKAEAFSGRESIVGIEQVEQLRSLNQRIGRKTLTNAGEDK